MDNRFMTPEGHRNFSAKKLFEEYGKIHWGAVAYIEKDGGGPEGCHTHSDDHLFIVIDGEVRVVSGEREYTVGKNESLYINGRVPHSIWNNGEQTAVVVKISTEHLDKD